MKNLTHNSFWFLICSQYFPRLPFLKSHPQDLWNEVKNKLESLPNRVPVKIPEVLGQSIGNKSHGLNGNDKKSLETLEAAITKLNGSRPAKTSKNEIEVEYISEYKASDDEWILEMRNVVNEFASTELSWDESENQKVIKKIDLNSLIALHERQFNERKERNQAQLWNLETKFILQSQQESWIKDHALPDQHPLIDLKLHFDDEEKFLSLLDRKQMESAQDKTRETIISENFVCQICNDQDYSSGDLIVYCSVSKSLFITVLILPSSEMQYFGASAMLWISQSA